MRTAIIAIMALTISACATPTPVVPDAVNIPPIPANLAVKAPPLPPITGNDLHSLIRDGLATDRLYADLRSRHSATVDLYECVRLAINTNSSPTDCLNGQGAPSPR